MRDLGRSDGLATFRFSTSHREGGLAARLAAADGQLLAPPRDRDELALVAELHEALIEALDTNALNASPPQGARETVADAAEQLIAQRELPVYGERRQRLIRAVVDEVLGLGPIQPLVDDDSVSEVMANGPDHVYVERNGVISLTEVRFRDDDHVRRVAERILSAIGRRVDEAAPMVDARLPDGSRVNITIPPATPEHPTITIRKFRRDRYTIEDLIRVGTLDERLAEFLGTCVTYRRNILISGGAGSGKTTLLNALSAFIPRSERIITIEDPVELALQQRHVVRMEARPPDMQGQHAITQRDLLRNALRMRPDRIIIGEIRGAEAFEMLQAMNTGHEGSLSTVHANSTRDALARVENMVLMSGVDLPVHAIREQIASALDLVIQLQRFPDGSRRIVRVSEVTGMEGLTITLQDLFVFKSAGLDDDGRVMGRFEPTGIRPTFSDAIELQGGVLEPSLFLPEGRR